MTFETVPVDDGLCAVEGCAERGLGQVCVYDHKYHHHGYIHYGNGHPWHPDLVFRVGTWHGICDAHYAVIEAAAKVAG